MATSCAGSGKAGKAGSYVKLYQSKIDMHYRATCATCGKKVVTTSQGKLLRKHTA